MPPDRLGKVFSFFFVLIALLKVDISKHDAKYLFSFLLTIAATLGCFIEHTVAGEELQLKD